MSRSPRTVSFFEFWPPWLFYAPVAVWYTLLALRYRSITLPSLANPSIYSGGICRESKAQILGLIPPEQQHRVARWALYQIPDLPAGERATHALTFAERNGLHLPFVVKPDQGQRGDGVCLVRTPEDLQRYLAGFPREVPLVLQALADLPHEAGVLYYRPPGSKRGRIFSITLKELPAVVGDGARTLRELILADPRAALVAPLYFRRHRRNLDRVLPAGRRIQLVFTGNHCQGAIFRDGTHLRTAAMTRAFAEVADSMDGFYFGRFDVKYRSMEDLRNGEGFLILEVNGATAEATHIWDANATLMSAYGTLFRQFSILFAIGDSIRRRGNRPIGALAILGDFRTYLRQKRAYPKAS